MKVEPLNYVPPNEVTRRNCFEDSINNDIMCNTLSDAYTITLVFEILHIFICNCCWLQSVNFSHLVIRETWPFLLAVSLHSKCSLNPCFSEYK